MECERGDSSFSLELKVLISYRCWSHWRPTLEVMPELPCDMRLYLQLNSRHLHSLYTWNIIFYCFYRVVACCYHLTKPIYEQVALQSQIECPHHRTTFHDKNKLKSKESNLKIRLFKLEKKANLERERERMFFSQSSSFSFYTIKKKNHTTF